MDRTGEHKVRALHAGPCPLYPVGANLVFAFPVSVRLPYLCSPSLSPFVLVVCVCPRLALVLQFRATGYTKPNTRKQAPF